MWSWKQLLCVEAGSEEPLQFKVGTLAFIWTGCRYILKPQVVFNAIDSTLGRMDYGLWGERKLNVETKKYGIDVSLIRIKFGTFLDFIWVENSIQYKSLYSWIINPKNYFTVKNVWYIGHTNYQENRNRTRSCSKKRNLNRHGQSRHEFSLDQASRTLLEYCPKYLVHNQYKSAVGARVHWGEGYMVMVCGFGLFYFTCGLLLLFFSLRVCCFWNFFLRFCGTSKTVAICGFGLIYVRFCGSGHFECGYFLPFSFVQFYVNISSILGAMWSAISLARAGV